MAFTWQSAAHAFASLFKDVVTVSQKITAVLTAIQGDATLIEALTQLVSPEAAAVEQIAFGALGELVAAVEAAANTVLTDGITVQFDATVVAEVQKLVIEFPDILAQVEGVFGKLAKG